MDPEAEQLAAIARKYGIVLLLRFGSSVTGKMHEHSDIDLAVLLREVPESWEVHGELLGDLQALYPGRDVDATVLNRADPLFLKKITEACTLVHGSERDLQRLKIYAFKRYQDHRKYLEMERRYVERSLHEMVRG